MLTRLIPKPVNSCLLFAIWLLVNNSVSPGHLVLATVLALVIPPLVQGLKESQPSIKKPLLAVRYLFVVLSDILIASFQVAYLTLGPIKKMRPGFVAVPIDIKDTLPLTLLASTVTLTPGSLGCGFSADYRWLYIHVINLKDPQEIIDTVKNRYEAPIKEIFGC